jgi:hypothetical protein
VYRTKKEGKEREKKRGIVQEGEGERAIETIKVGASACVREIGRDSKIERECMIKDI